MIIALNNTTTFLLQLADTQVQCMMLFGHADSIKKTAANKLHPLFQKDLLDGNFTTDSLADILNHIAHVGRFLHFRVFTSIALLAEVAGDKTLAGLLDKVKSVSNYEDVVVIKSDTFRSSSESRTLADVVTWKQGANTERLFADVFRAVGRVRRMTYLVDDFSIAQAMDNVEALLKLNHSLDFHLHQAVIVDKKEEFFNEIRPKYIPA